MSFSILPTKVGGASFHSPIYRRQRTCRIDTYIQVVEWVVRFLPLYLADSSSGFVASDMIQLQITCMVYSGRTTHANNTQLGNSNYNMYYEYVTVYSHNWTGLTNTHTQCTHSQYTHTHTLTIYTHSHNTHSQYTHTSHNTSTEEQFLICLLVIERAFICKVLKEVDIPRRARRRGEGNLL